MKAMHSMNSASFSCCSTAVACTSAHNNDILDTARVVVSILLLPIISVLRT